MLNTELKVDGKPFDVNNSALFGELVQEVKSFSDVNPSQLKEIAEAVKLGIERNIANAQKYTGGPVSPLALSTIRQKGFSRPLFLTGALLNSVELTQTNANAFNVFISSNRSEIASYLNYGTNKMPSRQFFGISEAVLRAIDEILSKDQSLTNG